MTDLQTAPDMTLLHAPDGPDAAWWRTAVVYQIYPRSWADSNGDGLGDLPGITARLPYLRDLGVDAIWLSPFYTSPMNDAGYDVADYRDIDPIFGTLADADTMLGTAHGLGLKVIVDLVPNHSSSEHPWFKAAVAAGPGSPERARYMFRDGKGEAGELPPNNWRSVFGGPGWSRVTEADGRPGQWYLHIFDVTQPDFDWTNAEVRSEFHEVIRFWLDRGVDGFRVDVAHGLVKEEGLPDWNAPMHLLDVEAEPADHIAQYDENGQERRPPMWDQEGVHEIYRGWREVLNEYTDPERILCAEAWVQPEERLARYLRPDEMHQAFNFEFLDAAWSAGAWAKVIASSYAANDAVSAPTSWVLSNHDVVRHASRLGLVQDGVRPNGIGANDPQPDAELGLRRARAATSFMLALPGSSYIYQGEELGLPESTDMPNDVRQDPTYLRTGHKVLGRDGCRVPIPWVKDAPSLGFGPSDQTWLPQPASYGSYAVDQQEGVDGSTLELYRAVLHARRDHGLGGGSARVAADLGPDVVAIEVAGTVGRVVAVLNTGAAPVALPTELGTLLLASGPLTETGELPTDTTVWLS